MNLSTLEGRAHRAHLCSSGSPDPEQVKSTAASYRSAGACPPRSPDLRENGTLAKAVSPTEARRGTGPRPTVKGRRFFTVARGPVPRDHSREKISSGP